MNGNPILYMNGNPIFIYERQSYQSGDRYKS